MLLNSTEFILCIFTPCRMQNVVYLQAAMPGSVISLNDLCRLRASFAFQFLCRDCGYIIQLEIVGAKLLGYSKSALDVHTNLHK